MPQSVRDIFVVRDAPHSRNDDRRAASRSAIAKRRNPALRCARPRDGALQTDEAAVAAERTDSERVKLIDLSDFMCDDEELLPGRRRRARHQGHRPPHADVLAHARAVPRPRDHAAAGAAGRDGAPRPD